MRWARSADEALSDATPSQARIEAAKKLLTECGFTVIENERVRVVEATTQVPWQNLADKDAGSLVDHIKTCLTADLGKLLGDSKVVTETREHRAMGDIFTCAVRVVLPDLKQKASA